MIVVSSGIGVIKAKPANWRMGVISYSTYSIMGSLRVLALIEN